MTNRAASGYDVCMKPILVLMAPGFEEIELTAPIDILRRLEIPVVTAGVKGRYVEGAHGMEMKADMLMVDVEAADYDGIKIKEVRSVGTLETVDSLVVVADCHDIWAAFVARIICEEADKFSLGVVCILKLIQKNVLEALLGIEADFVVVFKEADGV